MTGPVGRSDAWTQPAGPGRVPPRECIRAARDALNQMYGMGGQDLPKLWMFMAEALDWQRRAMEQIAEALDA